MAAFFCGEDCELEAGVGRARKQKLKIWETLINSTIVIPASAGMADKSELPMK